MLYLGVSETHEKQLTILEALTRNFPLHPNLSLERLASQLPFTYTGADFYALCSDAMLKAAIRQSSLVDAKISAINATNASLGKSKISTAYYFDHFATKEDVAVMVIEDDFWAAVRELIPSVSLKELEKYQRIRDQFEKREDEDQVKKQHDTKGKEKALDLSEGHEHYDIAPVSEKSELETQGSDRKGKGKEIMRQDEPIDFDYSGGD